MWEKRGFAHGFTSAECRFWPPFPPRRQDIVRDKLRDSVALKLLFPFILIECRSNFTLKLSAVR